MNEHVPQSKHIRPNQLVIHAGKSKASSTMHVSRV
jgi:hypothetical protein